MDDTPGPRPLRGRGTSEAPPGRFERQTLEPIPPSEPWEEPDPDPRTQYLPDASRSALARNQSPDIPFDVSLNPYRGCEHGCSYCLAPDTPILFADGVWRPLGEAKVGDVLMGFDEFPAPGRTRKLRKATIEALWWSRREMRRLVTERSQVWTTREHRWLQWHNFRWSRTEQLTPGQRLRHLPVTPPQPLDADYRDREPLRRCVAFLESFGVRVYLRPFSSGSRSSRPMWKVETRARSALEIIDKLITIELQSPSYRRGFVAGFFDAEGHHGGSLRMSQVDRAVLERIRHYAASFSFDLKLEPRAVSTVRLIGSVAERLRFFSTFEPAISRKREALFGVQPAWEPDRIEAVEDAGIGDVVDIQTSTGTFFAGGLATHNCYARPTHEFLGLSAGIDFETKIFVKHDAANLLRRELLRPTWKPQVIAMSGVTDPYQPAERRLRITRRCLEVLAEFRNPVGLITKSGGVVRDADLLGELAQHSAAAVTLSITTLDPDLARRLEPRAAQPRARLAAIETLASAGVPVSVNVAPVIPGLNDHEIPRILEHAAAAGARHAGYVLLRLPHGVKDLFAGWLEQHFPERKQKVLHRVQDTRGGRLYVARFGERQRGTGLFAEQVRNLFELARRRAGLEPRGTTLSADAFRRPGGQQLPLFRA